MRGEEGGEEGEGRVGGDEEGEEEINGTQW